MGLYMEGEIPTVVSGGSNNGSGMWGSDGIWAILLLALLGNRGFGFGGGYGGGSGCDCLGWQLGRLATTNDVASGFSTSEIMSDLNSIIVGQANMQNWINQGFYGIDRSVLQGFNGVDNAICTLGYQTQAGFNQLGNQLASCCCDIQRGIDGINYNMATNTGQIVNAINCGNQRVIDYLQSEKIDTLNRKLATAEAQLSNNAQSRYIVDTVLDKLSPCPRPAYITCNPNTGLTYPQGYTQANFGFNGNNGCSSCAGIL